MGVKSQAQWKWSGWMVPALKARTFSFCFQPQKCQKNWRKSENGWSYSCVKSPYGVTSFSVNRWKTWRMCMNSACLDAEWSAEFESVLGFDIRWTAEELFYRSGRMSKLPSRLGYHTTADIKVPEPRTWKQAMWSPNAEHGRKRLKSNISHWWNMTPGISSHCYMERNWSVVDGC